MINPEAVKFVQMRDREMAAAHRAKTVDSVLCTLIELGVMPCSPAANDNGNRTGLPRGKNRLARCKRSASRQEAPRSRPAVSCRGFSVVRSCWTTVWLRQTMPCSRSTHA